MAMMILPTMIPITACHTDSPALTSAAPCCQFERHIWLIAQKEMYAQRVQVRLLGGRGLISSFIHTDDTVLASDGTRRNSIIEDVPMFDEMDEPVMREMNEKTYF